MNTKSPTRMARWLATVAAIAILGSAVAAGAVAGTGGSDSTPSRIDATVADGSNSADAGRLLDGVTGPTDATSWRNALNPWRQTSYPMSATIDLGADHRDLSLRYFGGQIPSPTAAELTIETAPGDSPGSFSAAASATAPRYDRWSSEISVGDRVARYIRVSFNSLSQRFNLAEIEVFGTPVDGGSTGGPVTTGLGTQIDGVIATDGDNSANAARLVDRAEPTGTGDDSSWTNPSPWRDDSYPMTAVFDLGEGRDLTGLAYFVGNLVQGSNSVSFETSATDSGGDFKPLTTIDSGHRWNDWREVRIDASSVRRVRIRFDERTDRFNISEVRFFTGGTTPTTTGSTTTTSVTGPTTVPTSRPTTGPTTVPTTGPTTVPTSQPTTGPTTVPTTGPTTGETTTTTGAPVVPVGDQPQSAPPGPDVVRSFGFGSWPNDHLTPSCRDLHDSYWTRGPNAGASVDPNHPENRAYHTWHPALATNPATGERCDIGHEHGLDPRLAPAELFERSGGWPAFGYVAETLAGARHEDHVGHKVTVARFRASIGNGAGSEPLYDAGFECDWLSKIHQGSSTLDAFANHLHEYFLTLRCMDGLNADGVVDNTVVGTDFSIKVMYTYGKPNEFAEDGCARDDPATPQNETIFPADIVIGPEGQHVHPAQRTDPLGNDKPNNRGFTCSSGVIWKDVSEIQSVDLWTQLIKVERNDGNAALTVQPYYIVKNPARIVEAYDAAAGEKPTNVVRTISLCYDDAGNRLNRGFCDGAPDTEPDWRSPLSPFNGTLRALNFKSSHVQNANGPAEFCTDPFGFAVQDPAPCERGNILQKAGQFDNHWNDGRYRFGGNQGNIQGSIWAEDPKGNRFEATPADGGSYTPNGIGFEFIIDNRDPDDDHDGIPDGANVRAQN